MDYRYSQEREGKIDVEGEKGEYERNARADIANEYPPSTNNKQIAKLETVDAAAEIPPSSSLEQQPNTLPSTVDGTPLKIPNPPDDDPSTTSSSNSNGQLKTFPSMNNDGLGMFSSPSDDPLKIFPEEHVARELETMNAALLEASCKMNIAAHERMESLRYEARTKRIDHPDDDLVLQTKIELALTRRDHLKEFIAERIDAYYVDYLVLVGQEHEEAIRMRDEMNKKEKEERERKFQERERKRIEEEAEALRRERDDDEEDVDEGDVDEDEGEDEEEDLREDEEEEGSNDEDKVEKEDSNEDIERKDEKEETKDMPIVSPVSEPSPEELLAAKIEVAVKTVRNTSSFVSKIVMNRTTKEFDEIKRSKFEKLMNEQKELSLLERRAEAKRRVIEHKQHLEAEKKQKKDEERLRKEENERRRKLKAATFAAAERMEREKQEAQKQMMSKSMELSPSLRGKTPLGPPKTELAPLNDAKLRSKALKYLKTASQMPAKFSDSHLSNSSCLTYIARQSYGNKRSSTPSSRVGIDDKSSNGGNSSKDDTVWVLVQDPNGSVIGSKVVSIKVMEEKEQLEKEKAKNDDILLREAGWGSYSLPGPDREGKIIPLAASQKAAAHALMMREVAKQSGRNKSPTGLRDKPASVENPVNALSDEDKINHAKEGKLRRYGEGRDEAKGLILKWKGKLTKGGKHKKTKLSMVDQKLLDSPLIDSFHGANSRRAIARDEGENDRMKTASRGTSRKGRARGMNKSSSEDMRRNEDGASLTLLRNQDSSDGDVDSVSVHSVASGSKTKRGVERRGKDGNRDGGRSYKSEKSLSTSIDGNCSDDSDKFMGGDRGRSRRNFDLNVNSRNIVNMKHVPGLSSGATVAAMDPLKETDNEENYLMYDEEEDEEMFPPIPLDQPILLQKSEYIIQDEEELQQIARRLY